MPSMTNRTMSNRTMVTHQDSVLTPAKGVNYVTIFEGMSSPRTIDLNLFNLQEIRFGRESESNVGYNQIVFTTDIVGRNHGSLVRYGSTWKIVDNGSRNGLIYNDIKIQERVLSDGDIIRIDMAGAYLVGGVLMLFSSSTEGARWKSVSLSGFSEITIGRENGNTIQLMHTSVSKRHAKIFKKNDGKWYIADTGSRNGVILNGKRVRSDTLLLEKSVIDITNTKLVFTRESVWSFCYVAGVPVDVTDAVIAFGKGKKKKIGCDNVSLSINPGELVAVVGGSGAGKSTIMKCMAGYNPLTSGAVYINGINLYENLDSLKSMIGYVPQSDIVYQELTLYDMLNYTAGIRLPKDLSKAERNAAIEKAMKTVGLLEKKDRVIKDFSGGEKKRASIAVELLADPNLIFLDEPASGLDPGIEQDLMRSLRDMANNGKTIILVTHSTLQLYLCDKVLFMGKGGKLCFCGSVPEALRFFGEKNLVEVYYKLTYESETWKNKFNSMRAPLAPVNSSPTAGKSQSPTSKPTMTLFRRTMNLLFGDRQSMLISLVQPIVFIALIFLVCDTKKMYDNYEATKTVMFIVACCNFWMGLYNALAQISGERDIIKREYMVGLSLTSYISSKVLAMSFLGLMQTAIFTVFFTVIIGMPPEGGVMITSLPALEIFITLFLTNLSASALGLTLSSLAKKQGFSSVVIPIVLMVQLLFSGAIFALSGALKVASSLISCRWALEGLGTISNLNICDVVNQATRAGLTDGIEPAFVHESSHLVETWVYLGALTLGFLVLSRVFLKKNLSGRD